MEARTFNLVEHVTAEESVWKRIDKEVEVILACDSNEEVDVILLSSLDVKTGILSDRAVVIAVTKESVSDDLMRKVYDAGFTNTEWTSMCNVEHPLILWRRENNL